MKLAEIFQDIDGAYSSKRVSLFILIGTLVAMIGLPFVVKLGQEVLTYLGGALPTIATLTGTNLAAVASEQITKFAKGGSDASVPK